jgi:hypothetical protein
VVPFIRAADEKYSTEPSRFVASPEKPCPKATLAQTRVNPQNLLIWFQPKAAHNLPQPATSVSGMNRLSI